MTDATAAAFADSPITHIDGSVRIRTTTTRVVTLFPCLERIRDDLDAPLDGLTRELAGFERLEHVGGTIDIKIGDLVEALPGFARLVEVGGGLVFGPTTRTASLGAIDGFGALASVGGNLVIANVARVVGFSMLVEVGGDVSLLGDAMAPLSEVDGFASLVAVAGTLRVWNAAADFVVPAFASLQTTGGLVLLQVPPHDDAFPALAAIEGPAELTYRAPAAGSWVSAWADFPVLERVAGDLRLTTNGHTDLVAFPSLLEVGGKVTISTSSTLEQLAGFAALTRAGGLGILDNPSLVSIAGFDALGELDGSFAVAGNGALASLAPFPSLRHVRGALEVERNASLETLDAFHALWAAGRIEVADLPRLTSWQGFGDLRLADAIYVLRNEKLGAVPTFPQLTRLTADLRVGGNTELEKLEGFPALEQARSIQMAQNRRLLFSVGGFDALQTLSGELRVQASQFDRVSIDGFYELRTVSGGLEFGDATWVSIICPSLQKLESPPPPECSESEGGGGLR